MNTKRTKRIAYRNQPSLAGAYDFSVSPDGRLIAFMRSEAIISSKGKGWCTKLSIYDIGSGRVRKFQDSLAKNDDIIWSPDASWLAFTRPEIAFTSPEHNYTAIVLVDSALACFKIHSDSTLGRWWLAIAWSSDSKEIFAYQPSGAPCLHIIDPLQLRQKLEFLPLSIPVVSGDSSFLPSKFSLSPDNNQIAFVATVTDNGVDNFKEYFQNEATYLALFLYDRTTKAIRRLTPQSFSVMHRAPIWLKDNKTIVFSSLEAPQRLRKTSKVNFNIYSVSVNAKHPKLLTSKGDLIGVRTIP
jgi:Tol biopolymer transport system component